MYNNTRKQKLISLKIYITCEYQNYLLTAVFAHQYKWSKFLKGKYIPKKQKDILIYVYIFFK